MGTVQKRADELKRGDVITDFLGTANVRCPAVLVDNYSCGAIRAHDPFGGVGTILIGYAQKVEVESPDLTPAQQHAEELAEALRTVLDCEDVGAVLYARHIENFRALLDKIRPPEPPTLEEALSALRDVMEKRGNTPAAIELLDRARRAGLLK